MDRVQVLGPGCSARYPMTIENNNPIVRLVAALLCVFAAGAADAECLSIDKPSSACRYPAGDAWCARHGDGNLYAYRDNCAEEGNRAETRATTRPPAAAGSWSPVPAWDCAKARTATERLICANPDIRAQDARMGAVYARLQARGTAPERAQKSWLLDRRNVCDSADCLRAAYAERIRDLERLAGSGGAPVEERSFEMARVAPQTPAVPQTRTRPPEPTPEPVAEVSPEPTPEPVAQPFPAPTPDMSQLRPETGIPDLPLPEGPTLEARRREAASGSAPYREGGTPPARGSGLLSASIAALALAAGLIVWRRRARIRAAVESSRPRLARIGERMRTAPGARLAGLRDLRTRAQTSPRPSAPAPEAAPVSAVTSADLHLSDDIAARLRALARPGERLSSVVARAVAALEASSERPSPEAVLSRLAALEARLAQLDGTGTGERT